MKLGIFKIPLLLLLLSVSSLAQAIPVNFSIQGTVNNASMINPFGLSVGDIVFASAMFDDSFINSMGSSDVQFGTTGNAFGSSLTLKIGIISFSESNDADYIGGTSPSLSFENGIFSGFNFLTETGINGATVDFDAFELGLFGFNAGIENLIGSWNLDTATITPVASVPEPTSMMLLGLGVIGLIGAKRKLLIK